MIMKSFWDAIDRSVEWAVAFLFLAIVAVGTLQVANRFLLNVSLSWSEEFQRYGQIWLVFLAIPVAYRRSEHIGVDLIHDVLHARFSLLLRIIIEFMWIALAVGIMFGTWKLMGFLQFQRSPGLDWPMHYVYGALLIGPAYMATISFRRIASLMRDGAA
jgi:TRAP-type transport system small permease protein